MMNINKNIETIQHLKILLGSQMISSIQEDTKPPKKILWGVAPTGDFHFGYAANLLFIRKLMKLGSEPLILIANYHGYLDSEKTEWTNIDHRTKLYKDTFSEVGFDNTIETKNVYSDPNYLVEVFKISKFFNVEDLHKAGITTLTERMGCLTLAELLYVAAQILDIKIFGVDAVMCGLDEADIYRYGIPIIENAYSISVDWFYLNLCPGLNQCEMHCTDDNDNKILFFEEQRDAKKKVELHLSLIGVENSKLLDYFLDFFMPLADQSSLKDDLLRYKSNRNEIGCTNVIVQSILDVQAQLRNG